MNQYVPNRTCQCPRCRARGLMGAAVLITLGVLFLLDELSRVSFDQSFPALLIVIGVIIYLGRSAPIDGHVQPGGPGSITPPPPPSVADQTGSEVTR